MKTLITLLAVTSATFAITSSVHAQDRADSDTNSWYLATSGSASLLNDSHLVITAPNFPGGVVDTTFPFKTGYGAQAAVGRDFGGFRLEAEAGYTANHSNQYTANIPPTGRIPSNGRQSAVRVMANGYLDLGHGIVRPYIGAGVGWSRVNLRITAPRAPFPTEAPMRLIDDHASGFAWQAMAGAAIAVSPNLSFTAGYRWHSVGRFRAHDLGGRVFTSRHAGSNIDIGIRVRL